MVNQHLHASRPLILELKNLLYPSLRVPHIVNVCVFVRIFVSVCFYLSQFIIYHQSASQSGFKRVDPHRV